MILFFDTSALVKLFHEEEGTEKVTDLVARVTNDNVWFSELTKLEFVSTLHRKYREKEIDLEQLNASIIDFEEFAAGAHLEELTSELLAEASELIGIHGKSIGLRTLDSIILATYSLVSDDDWQFVVADKALADVARKMSFSVLNPLD